MTNVATPYGLGRECSTAVELLHLHFISVLSVSIVEKVLSDQQLLVFLSIFCQQEEKIRGPNTTGLIHIWLEMLLLSMLHHKPGNLKVTKSITLS